MKKIRKILAIAPGCLAAMLYGGNLLADLSDVYVGMDLLKTNYATKDRYGSNVFAKNPMAFNAFVGYKLPHNLFIEAGYERSKSKSRTVNGVDWGDLPGAYPSIPRGLATMNVETRIKIEHPYVGIGISCPLSFVNNTTVSGLVGLSSTRLRANLNDIDDHSNDSSFSKRKVNPLVKASLNHSISNSFDVHFTASWHKLTNFKLKTEQAPNGPLELRMKNGYAFGLGLTYYFS